MLNFCVSLRGGRPPRTTDLLIDQLRAIDNRSLVQGPLTKLLAPLMERIHEALTEVLHLDPDRN